MLPDASAAPERPPIRCNSPHEREVATPPIPLWAADAFSPDCHRGRRCLLLESVRATGTPKIAYRNLPSSCPLYFAFLFTEPSGTMRPTKGGVLCPAQSSFS